MNAFLNKISQFTSVHEVLLFAGEGDLLYYYHRDKKAADSRLGTFWYRLIDDLGSPATADFQFDGGRYFLVELALGTLLIGLDDDQQFQAIKEGCFNVRQKLKDRNIRQNVLMRLFHENTSKLRPQHVRLLRSVAGPEVAAVLTPILENQELLSSSSGNELIAAVCEVLGYCRTSEALQSLQAYLQKYEGSQEAGQPLEAAHIAVAQLQLDRLESNTAEPIDLDKTTVVRSTAGGPSPDTKSAIERLGKLSPTEQEIQKLLDQNKQDLFLPRILELIGSSARKKDFAQAERYRQMLISGAPMALREIISAAEIIEEEKSSSLSAMVLSTWDELIQALSLEEFSALYYATQPRNTTSGEIIVKQGDFLSNLFLVNSGRVQLYTTRHGTDVPFKTVSDGEIFGAETFFDISVWTVSAKSLGASLSVLNWDRLAVLKEDYPALQNKLMDFCARFRGGDTHFVNPSASRRKYERKKALGRATIDLINEQGKEMGQVSRGDLLDISQGGVAFVLRFHKKGKAVDLLGKRLKIAIRPEQATVPMLRTGLVKAVRSYDFVGNDYSVHVEFDDLLSSTEVAQAAAKKSG